VLHVLAMLRALRDAQSPSRRTELKNLARAIHLLATQEPDNDLDRHDFAHMMTVFDEIESAP
jgi:hypothetical protein